MSLNLISPPDGVISRFDRAIWMTPPFSLMWAQPTEYISITKTVLGTSATRTVLGTSTTKEIRGISMSKKWRQ